MPTKKPDTFTVEGTYPFPVDMLRYDACYPLTSHDAVQMAAMIQFPRRADSKDRPRQVTLRTHAYGRPTVGRWESFGWHVV